MWARPERRVVHTRVSLLSVFGCERRCRLDHEARSSCRATSEFQTLHRRAAPRSDKRPLGLDRVEAQDSECFPKGRDSDTSTAGSRQRRKTASRSTRRRTWCFASTLSRPSGHKVAGSGPGPLQSGGFLLLFLELANRSALHPSARQQTARPLLLHRVVPVFMSGRASP